MKYEIVRVGIPSRIEDVSISFLETVQNIKNRNDCIALTTIDYPNNYNTDVLSAPAGHKILFDNLEFNRFEDTLHCNIVNTFGSIWDIANSEGKFRDSSTLVQVLLNLLDEQYTRLKFNRVYIFTPGSPYVYDGITNSLQKIRAVSVIDAKSTIRIIADTLLKLNPDIKFVKIREYTADFLENKNRTIHEDVINIFGSIDNRRNYNTNLPMLNQFFMDLKEILNDDDIFWYCTIKDYETDPIVTKITFKQAFDNIDMFIESGDIYTYGIYKLKEH